MNICHCEEAIILDFVFKHGPFSLIKPSEAEPQIITEVICNASGVHAPLPFGMNIPLDQWARWSIEHNYSCGSAELVNGSLK
eukprot:371490-Lingulodinium_polyedra.AAC.1